MLADQGPSGPDHLADALVGTIAFLHEAAEAWMSVEKGQLLDREAGTQMCVEFVVWGGHATVSIGRKVPWGQPNYRQPARES